MLKMFTPHAPSGEGSSTGSSSGSDSFGDAEDESRQAAFVEVVKLPILKV